MIVQGGCDERLIFHALSKCWALYDAQGAIGSYFNIFLFIFLIFKGSENTRIVELFFLLIGATPGPARASASLVSPATTATGPVLSTLTGRTVGKSAIAKTTLFATGPTVAALAPLVKT